MFLSNYSIGGARIQFKNPSRQTNVKPISNQNKGAKTKGDKLVPVLPFRFLILVLLMAFAAIGEAPAQADKESLVQRALANEVRAATESLHPMRYRLRKSSPRLTTTKEICETKDGAVALLVEINDKPLSPLDAQREQARLEALLSDPGKQRHRKQSQDEDTARALKMLRALPAAFVYQYSGSGEGPTGKVEKFTFAPHPKFDPPDLETQALVHMRGEIWIDPVRERVARLEGHLQQDVDFGWGILGRLYKGGSIAIEQADVGDQQWRIVHFTMSMSGRVVFKTKVFDTTEDESQFVPVPAGLGYQQAIHLLREQQQTKANSESRDFARR